MANKKKKSNETEKKGFWASSAVILGVISAVLGIVLCVYNILAARHNRQQFGSQDEKVRLENEKFKQELLAYEPRFEVAYISISPNLYKEIKQSEESKDQTFFLSYPTVPNEVASETLDTIATLPTDEANGEALEERVTCLVLQNKGKRDAVDVTLHIDRLAINRPITIQESSGNQSEDYDAKFRGAATSVDTRSFAIPVSIGAGGGVLIPLFASHNPSKYVTQNRAWFLVSNVAYLPRTITFIDPLDNQPKSLQVRKMKTPTWVDVGYEVRG